MKFFAVLLTSLLISNCFAQENKAITINQFADHPALNDVTDGLIEILKASDLYKTHKLTITQQTAQGNINTAVQIANHFASNKPDVMVAIATPSAQSSLKARKSSATIVAFAAVSDPEAAGLFVKENVLGVSDDPSVEELLTIAIKILPKHSNMGIIYNAAEINSVRTVKRVEEFAKNNHITIFPVTINSTNDLIQSFNSLIGKVDFIYLPQDNTVISGINIISKFAKTHKIPLISNVPTIIDNGVLLVVGCDYKESGTQLGNLIIDRLVSGKTESLIEPAKVREQKINLQVANELNIVIPAEFKSLAK